MRIQVKFAEISKRIPVTFGESVQHLPADMGEFQTVTEYIGGEKFEGEYIVTPKVEEQTIPTKDKVLIDDMTIKSIPFFNVSNTSGGSTVYIGNEV
jgi:hypothetical protein